MRNFSKIFGFTVIDLIHHKSFYVILTLSIIFVLMLKGCYKQDYTINGQHVDSTTVAWHASIIAFNIISAAALFIAGLLSIGGLKRDREDGSISYILSGPVSRVEYLLARVAGQAAVSFMFMFILHSVIMIIAFVNTGGVIPGYLMASLMCSLNVILMVVIINILSLIMSDFATAITSLAIAAVSFISDSFFQAVNSDIVKSAMHQPMPDPSLWRILWPKIASLQFFAASTIDHSGFHSMGPLNPSVNIAFYILILGALLVFRFKKEEL